MVKVLERELERHFSAECRRLNIVSLKLMLKFATGWPDRVIPLRNQVFSRQGKKLFTSY